MAKLPAPPATAAPIAGCLCGLPHLRRCKKRGALVSHHSQAHKLGFCEHFASSASTGHTSTAWCMALLEGVCDLPALHVHGDASQSAQSHALVYNARTQSRYQECIPPQRGAWHCWEASVTCPLSRGWIAVQPMPPSCSVCMTGSTQMLSRQISLHADMRLPTATSLNWSMLPTCSVCLKGLLSCLVWLKLPCVAAGMHAWESHGKRVWYAVLPDQHLDKA